MKKNVLITGAGGNLGRATVERFVNDGYRVIATVSSGKKLEYPTSPDVSVFSVDLTKEEPSQRFIEEITNYHSRIDVAVLLVGGFAPGDLEHTDSALLQKMISMNFNTAYNIVRPLYLHMSKQRGGRIVLIGSRPSLDPVSGKHVVAYSLSKSMLFSLAEILNKDGEEKNIVTSVVVPSTIDTPINRAAMPNADFSTWVTVDEIAGMIAFAVSDNARALHNPIMKVYGH